MLTTSCSIIGKLLEVCFSLHYGHSDATLQTIWKNTATKATTQISDGLTFEKSGSRQLIRWQTSVKTGAGKKHFHLQYRTNEAIQ